MKYRLFITLFVLVILSSGNVCFSQLFKNNSNIITYRGNRFEKAATEIDTVTETNPKTGDEIIKIFMLDSPVIKMNGQHIYQSVVTAPKARPYPANGSLELYILKSLSKELSKLPDGTFDLDLDRIIVDKKGKIVYYEYSGLDQSAPQNKKDSLDYKEIMIPPAIKEEISKKIDPIINKAPLMQPAKYNGKNVIANSGIYLSKYKIIVRGHTVSFLQN